MSLLSYYLVCWLNRVEEVQQALDQGFAVSSRDENGKHPSSCQGTS